MPPGSSVASVTILAVAARRVDQLADLRRVRVAQQRLGVRALAARRDERALEVDAGDVALLDELGQQAGLAGRGRPCRR